MTDNAAIASDNETPIDRRLQETAAMCLSSLEKWKANLKDEDARETLMEAVHELRKVCSRLEIDIAMNDRQNTNAKRIPVPEHKSKTETRKDQKPLSEILPVAEIRKANERKKIEIASADEDDNDNVDFDTMDMDDDTPQPESNTGDTPSPKQRRPRRKKRDTNNDDGNKD